MPNCPDGAPFIIYSRLPLIKVREIVTSSHFFSLFKMASGGETVNVFKMAEP